MLKYELTLECNLAESYQLPMLQITSWAQVCYHRSEAAYLPSPPCFLALRRTSGGVPVAVQTNVIKSDHATANKNFS